MKEMYSNYAKFAAMLKMQLTILFIIVLSYSMIIPITTKLHGQIWTITLISVYLIGQNVGALVAIYLKNWTLRTLYRIIIIIDITQLIVISSYSINAELFIILESITMFGYSVVIKAYMINYATFVTERYTSTVFKELQYVEGVVMGTAGIVAYLTALLLDTLVGSIAIALAVVFAINAIAIMVENYSYNKYFKGI